MSMDRAWEYRGRQPVWEALELSDAFSQCLVPAEEYTIQSFYMPLFIHIDGQSNNASSIYSRIRIQSLLSAIQQNLQHIH